MQLIKYDEAIEMLNIPEDFKKNNIKCIRYEPDKRGFYFYVFICTFQNEEELLKDYDSINEIIALDFQSLLEKNIEKWNIYLFYFVEKTISNKTRYIIEQDKYATRKLIIPGGLVVQSFEEKIEIIKSELFTLNFDSDSDNEIIGSIENLIYDFNPELLNYISQYTINRLTKKINKKESKSNLLRYLEVKSYE